MRVIVVGGGPGGAACAGLLAAEGADVTLLERAEFPRHHVGESLQPATLTLLDRHFGLGPALDAAGFPRKYGAVYVWGEHQEPWSVLFDPALESQVDALDAAGLRDGGFEHAYNVDRAVFDDLVLGAARVVGVDVRHGWEVVGPLGDASGVTGVRARGPDGPEELVADHVVDASGQRCLLGRAFRLTRTVEDLRSTATYAYFDGAGGVPGVLGRLVQWVVSVPQGWVWFIPVSAERTSVGVVHRGRTRLSEQDFEEALALAGLPLAGAHRAQVAGRTLHHARDWSFTHRQLHGPGWVLIGDAACFVDPILSGGVDFAVRTGLGAAVALLQGDLDGYATRARQEYRAYLRLARYWYGNNRSTEGLFWEAHRLLDHPDRTTPLRAFVYLTTGHYAADRHFRVFQRWQEEKMFRALGVDPATGQG